MALTGKQEAFAQAVASGLSQAEAYRTAYDVDPECKPETIWVNASQLMSDTNVRQRVDSLRDDIAAKALWTREDSVRTLKSVIEGNDKGSEITGAVKVLNEMHGYNAPQKVELSGKDGSPIKTQAVADMTDEELALKLAKYGIKQ